MSQRDENPPSDREASEGRSRFDGPPPRPPRKHPGTVRRRPEDKPAAPQNQSAEPPPPRPARFDRPARERPPAQYPPQHRPRADWQRPRDRQPQRSERSPPPPDVVSGLHAVTALLRWQPARVQALYLWASDPRVRARLQELAQAASVRVEAAPPQGFANDSGNPQGVAARVTPFEYADLERVLPLTGPADGTLLLCLDSITDPRNLGAILRSAAFFRATAVILPQDRSAEVTALVERIAEGGAASVPVVQVVNLARTLGSLRDRGVEVVGTALDGATADLRCHVWTRATALVLGAEGTGIRPLVRKNCDVLVTLAGPEQMPSLNVSAFATLAMAMVRRQP